jgi:transmembrane sensor
MSAALSMGRPSDDEAIEARAAAWLAQRDAGMAPDEEAAFLRWRRADPRHAAAVSRLEAAWRVLQTLREYRPEAAVHPDPDLLGRPKRRRLLAFPVLVAAAAAIMLAALWWRPQPSVAPVEQHYATTTGGFQRLTLADGSMVELNASSELTVRYTPAERRVRLLRGEAHFSVAKNKQRPFWVEADAVAVRAVGTAFNVRFGDRQVEVLVTEGSVHVDRGATAALPLLSAGERALIAMQGNAVPVVEKIAPRMLQEAMAWADGSRLFFAETPLADVVAQFNRRNRVQLSLATEELAGVPVGGSFKAENVESFVALLTSNGDIVAERPDPDRIVLRKMR